MAAHFPKLTEKTYRYKTVEDVREHANEYTSPTLIHGSSGGDASVVYIQKSPDEWKPLIVAGGGGGWCSNNFPIPPNTHSKKPPSMKENAFISYGDGSSKGGKAIIVRYIIITNELSNVKLVNLKIKNNDDKDINLRDLLENKSAKIVQGLLSLKSNGDIDVKPVSKSFKQDGLVCDSDWNNNTCSGSKTNLRKGTMGYKDCATECQKYFKNKNPTDPDVFKGPKGCCQIDSYGNCSVIEGGNINTDKYGNKFNTKCIIQGEINNLPEWKPIKSVTYSDYWMSVPPLYNNGELIRPAFMQIDLGMNYLLKDLIFDFPNLPHRSNNNKLHLFSDSLYNLDIKNPGA